MTFWVRMLTYSSSGLIVGFMLFYDTVFSFPPNSFLDIAIKKVFSFSVIIMVIIIVYVFVRPLLVFCPKCKKRCKFHPDEFGRTSALKCPECKSIYEMDGTYYWD